MVLRTASTQAESVIASEARQSGLCREQVQIASQNRLAMTDKIGRTSQSSSGYPYELSLRAKRGNLVFVRILFLLCHPEPLLRRIF
jgi:hypothetical protein